MCGILIDLEYIISLYREPQMKLLTAHMVNNSGNYVKRNTNRSGLKEEAIAI